MDGRGFRLDGSYILLNGRIILLDGWVFPIGESDFLIGRRDFRLGWRDFRLDLGCSRSKKSADTVGIQTRKSVENEVRFWVDYLMVFSCPSTA